MDNRVKFENIISFWRVIFTVSIVLLHLFNSYGFSTGLACGVEFFFIVSGWLLMQEYKRKKLSVFSYTKNRIKRLYPEYILAFVVSLLFFTLFGGHSIKWILGWFATTGIFEMVMLHFWRWMSAPMANVVTWYVSVLVIAGSAIYYAVKNFNPILRRILFILIPAIFYFYTYFVHGTFMINGIYGSICFFRGMSELCIGCILFELNELEIIKELCNKKIVRLIGSFALIAELVLSFFFADKMSYLFILLLSFGVLVSFNIPLHFANRQIRFLDKISYSMYLNHIVVRSYIMPRLFDNLTPITIATYIVIVFVFSLFEYNLVLFLNKKIFKKI